MMDFSHNVTQLLPDNGHVTSTDGRRSTGGADVGDLSFSKYLDQASPLLHQYCCEGTDKEFNVEIHVCDDNHTVLKILLEKAIVSNVSLSAGMDVTESVSLNFLKIKWIYQPRGKASTEGQWNVARKKVQ